MNFVWKLVLLSALQVATAIVPIPGEATNLRQLREASRQSDVIPAWQWLLWAAVGAAGLGLISFLCVAQSWARKQRELVYMMVPEASSRVCEEDQREISESITNMSVSAILARQKSVVLAKSVAAISFRLVDTSLDAIAGVKFHEAGDTLWASIAFAIIILSPVPQYLYIKIQRGWAASATQYLIPGSLTHVKREIKQIRFIAQLPKIALFCDIHRSVATGRLNTILSCMECAGESLPQALLQLHVFFVKGGDWVNLLSIAFSLIGIALGVVLAVQILVSEADVCGSRRRDEIAVPFADGCSVDLHGMALDDQTIDAVFWLAANDQDLCVWNFSECQRVDDVFLQRFFKICPKLTKIYLRRCHRITDSVLQELGQRCCELIVVDITADRAKGSQVGDIGVKAIALGCPQLRKVVMEGCKYVTDGGVKALARRCSELTYVSLLSCSNITDDAVKELAQRCTGLNTLSLASCHHITNDSLKALALNCNDLVSLDVQYCSEVTDDGIKYLAERCHALQFLDAANTKVTEVVKSELRAKYAELLIR